MPDDQSKRGRGRPPLSPDQKKARPPKKRHMVAGAVSYDIKRRVGIQARHEGRTIGAILEAALAMYLDRATPT